MAVQTPFFGKREPETFQPRHASAPATMPTQPAQNVTTPASASTTAPGSAGSKLTVGPNIKLKGVEITDCDTLVVEGTVEATMDSRVIQISEEGAFRGSAEIDIAEIFSTGKVSGKIRYGKLVVEEGGQLSGEIDVGTTVRAASKPRPVDAVAAVA